MSLTLANAAEVFDHCATTTPNGGFTRTHHHVGYLEPGDLWRPEQLEWPRTVTELRRHADRIILIDQGGDSYSYPTNAVLATAVADPLVSTHTELVHS